MKILSALFLVVFIAANVAADVVYVTTRKLHGPGANDDGTYADNGFDDDSDAVSTAPGDPLRSGSSYFVSDRKLLLFETARIVEWLGRVMGGGFSIRSLRSRQNSPATKTRLLSDLAVSFTAGGLRPPARAFRRAFVAAPAAPVR